MLNAKYEPIALIIDASNIVRTVSQCQKGEYELY